MCKLDHKESRAPNNDAFELWCWRRLLRVPWTAGRSNQSILKEISPEYSSEGLMLKLKCQYNGHLMQRTHWKRPWWWERLKAGEEGDDREWDGWMASVTRWTWVWASSGSWWWIGRADWRAAVHEIGKSRIQLSDWTEQHPASHQSYESQFSKPQGNVVTYVEQGLLCLFHQWDS